MVVMSGARTNTHHQTPQDPTNLTHLDDAAQTFDREPIAVIVSANAHFEAC